MSEFVSVELDKNIYQIKDTAGSCATLVVGENKALLFDTMFGQGNLKKFINEITLMPMIVINSHGHKDHMGGNFQFDKVYLNEKDWELIPINLGHLDEVEKNTGYDMSNCRKSLGNTDNIENIEPGTVFDLGGIRARIVALPGHTAGSIGVLLEEKRILLAGDACTPEMCLFMDGSQALSVYKKTLDYIDSLGIKSFTLGHHMKLFPASLIERYKECAELVGKKKGRFFQYSQIPSYTGKIYFLDYFNEDAGTSICIILPEDSQ